MKVMHWTAAGLAIAGKPAVAMMQNSGLGNAVSPITSLAHIFRIPLLIITTHRGEAGLKDEPQHELMGKITTGLFEIMETPWELFPDDESEIDACLQRATEYMKKEKRPYALLMRKGTVAAHELHANPVPSVAGRSIERKTFGDTGEVRPGRQDVLRKIIEHSPVANSVVVATTGFTGRELFASEDRDNQLYMVGSMGCASSLGLGISLARPDLQVIVIDGDGAALMRMGNFATVASYAGSNFTHILLDNEVHDSTGAQATVTANLSFADIAAACGYQRCYRGNDLEIIPALLRPGNHSGPGFAHIKIRSGTMADLPRPDVSPEQVLQRLMKNIGTSF